MEFLITQKVTEWLVGDESIQRGRCVKERWTGNAVVSCGER